MKKTTILLSALIAFSTMADAQTAKFSSFSYSGNDTRYDKTIDKNNQYINPILSGFYPDPSVCRKGDTYYLVNSSFSFFPGIPIFSSKDLVNWTQMGSVLDRESQLPLAHQGVSGGIFAPAITYNEKNKTFYMITTNIGRGNFFVKTKDPAKGWSEPIYLRQVNGIDPSFFFDKDGKGYIVNNAEPDGGHSYEGERAIHIHQFDVKGDSIFGSEKEILRSGTHVQKNPIWIEGPHLFRVGNYYYLMCAEGGTGDWHSEVILRSKNPMGPFEEYNGNPILTQRTGLDPDREDIVTSTGHADLVQTPKGDWYAVFLGCRPYDGDNYNTGRETFLLPVTWKNGWPTILDKGKVVPTVVNKKGLQPIADNKITGNFSYVDKFKDAKLSNRWLFLRNPSQFYTLGADGLTINPLPVKISERESPSAIFCRQQHLDFTAQTTVMFSPKSDKDLAGFTLLQNENFNFLFGKTIIGGKPAIILTRTEKNNVTIGSVMLTDSEASQSINLKITGKGRYYDFEYSVGNSNEWHTLARGVDAGNLSTHQSGGFIGVMIGLYATAVK